MAPPRAHAVRKMDIDGFSTRSTSLMRTGERCLDAPRSSRTSAASTLSTEPSHMVQQRTNSCIRICDKTSPHAHPTKQSDCWTYQLFCHTTRTERGRTRVKTVVKETVSLSRAKSLHEARHDRPKMPLDRLWVGTCAHRRPRNNFTPPVRCACTV